VQDAATRFPETARGREVTAARADEDEDEDEDEDAA
jgi:hypothetical protein